MSIRLTNSILLFEIDKYCFYFY